MYFAKLFPVYFTYAILIQESAKQTTILRNNDHKQRDNNPKPKSAAKTRSTKQNATTTSKKQKAKEGIPKAKTIVNGDVTESKSKRTVNVTRETETIVKGKKNQI